MGRRSIWHLTTFMVVIIPVAVAINYVGKLAGQALGTFVWLDSIGTMLAAMIGGPIVGAVSGAINNIIYGFIDPRSLWYAITSVFIGVVAGYLAYKGWTRTVWSAVGMGILVAIVSAIVSTPINVMLWGGTTGIPWGDAIFTGLRLDGFPLWIASFLDEFAVDLPDKMITVLVATAIFRSLPKRLLAQSSAGVPEVSE